MGRRQDMVCKTHGHSAGQSQTKNPKTSSEGRWRVEGEAKTLHEEESKPSPKEECWALRCYWIQKYFFHTDSHCERDTFKT